MSIELAALVAKIAHKGQKYGDKDYFETHITDVVRICRVLTMNVPGNYNTREKLISIAYLHDIIEDTEVTFEDLKDSFGSDIAKSVSTLSKKKEVPYDKYIKEIVDDELARTVKIADTISNLNASLKDENQKRIIKYSNQLNSLLTVRKF